MLKGWHWRPLSICTTTHLIRSPEVGQVIVPALHTQASSQGSITSFFGHIHLRTDLQEIICVTR